MAEKRVITKHAHHVQQKLCLTRPPYRQGKRLTAVKVYTVNDESQHLMICGVPKLQLGEEVKGLVSPYGDVKQIHVASEYPVEEFTEAYHVQYARIQSARIAKRFLDGKNFYGGLLHVFYVPELESITETRAKLFQRRKDVSMRIKRNLEDTTNLDTDKFVPKEQYHRRKKTPALPLTEERLAQKFPGETLISIYNGIPSHIDPRPISEPSLPSCSNYYERDTSIPHTLQAPYQPAEAIIKAAEDAKPGSSVNSTKRKNYKGQPIKNNVKVRVVRPQIIDTSNIVKWNPPDKNNIFSNVKKVENNIVIKLVPKHNDEKKKIVIKSSSTKQLVQPSECLQSSILSAKSQIRAAMEKQELAESS